VLSPPAPVVPLREDRGSRRRRVAGAVCLLLGLGLLAGAGIGAAASGGGPDGAGSGSAPAAASAYARARGTWRSIPVDDLFPPTVHGVGAGPGGADRTWTRIGTAAPAGCSGAFDPLLARVLAPVGCVRLLRATYTDATSSGVTTVGVLVTRADEAGMRRLRARWTAQRLADRTDLLPRTYPVPGTDAAGFHAAQRASWTVLLPTGLPVVVFAVSGFADGRAVPQPQPAAQAVSPSATTAPAQAGLGQDAVALATATEAHYARAAAPSPQPTARTSPSSTASAIEGAR
jgi:hypothetical protein